LPAAGIRRGSVFKIEGQGAAALTAAAAAGRWLGERTQEGFGRFRVDAELPGVTSPANVPEEPPLLSGGSEDPEERLAAITRGWLNSHPHLANPSTASERRPSRSQWQDLLVELRNDPDHALASRLSPTTAGAMVWTNKDAIEILNHLKALSRQEQLAHAQMFVRWLCTKMNANMQGSR
jgi:hypothetical protein